MRGLGLALAVLGGGVGIYLISRRPSGQPATPVQTFEREGAYPKAVMGPTLDVSSLDAGLSAREKAAVAYAVRSETDALSLVRFSDSLGPEFPVAASILQVRAGQLLGGGFEG